MATREVKRQNPYMSARPSPSPVLRSYLLFVKTGEGGVARAREQSRAQINYHLSMSSGVVDRIRLICVPVLFFLFSYDIFVVCHSSQNGIIFLKIFGAMPPMCGHSSVSALCCWIFLRSGRIIIWSLRLPLYTGRCLVFLWEPKSLIGGLSGMESAGIREKFLWRRGVRYSCF